MYKRQGVYCAPSASSEELNKIKRYGMGVSKREKQFYKEQLKTLELGLEDRMTAKLGNIINVYNKTSHYSNFLLCATQ